MTTLAQIANVLPILSKRRGRRDATPPRQGDPKFRNLTKAELKNEGEKMLKRLRDEHQIKAYKSGMRLGGTARVVPDLSGSGTWVLPESFDIDAVPAAELKVALGLGILSLDLLTSEQRERFQATLGQKIPGGTTKRLMARIAASGTSK